MNKEIKNQLDTIASACRLLQDSDTNRLKLNNRMIDALVEHTKGHLSEAQSAEKLRGIINDAGEAIAQQLFGQASLAVSDETIKANKATVSEWADNRQLRKGHHKVLDVLALRPYPVTIRTIRRETGLMIPTISSYIYALRQEGHQIETIRKGMRSNPKYQLIAKAA